MVLDEVGRLGWLWTWGVRVRVDSECCGCWQCSASGHGIVDCSEDPVGLWMAYRGSCAARPLKSAAGCCINDSELNGTRAAVLFVQHSTYSAVFLTHSISDRSHGLQCQASHQQHPLFSPLFLTLSLTDHSALTLSPASRHSLPFFNRGRPISKAGPEGLVDPLKVNASGRGFTHSLDH